ncbi:MAG TPA: hypothetical protein DD723_00075 [Candidatus Omnitrophica bacterium]|nr:MAG: hypothetical protein A2Z81_07255 [Omnitrophica WOR_2 bacterium GWA2_45_18]HBR13931.1 hypothetical protein [Candidatus Omnitrophota bacterium]
MYKKTVLPNGLRVITHDMKERDSIALGLWIGVGGRYEEGHWQGAAHFLEHIVFKGSRKYSCEEIKALIEGVGGSLNAFTSEEQTCFYAKIPSKHLHQTFDVLADMVFSPEITRRDVLKESTVIVEEIKMYHDLPQYFVLELLDELIWPDHPLGRSLSGTAETVTRMSNRDLRKFHEMYYSPGNIVVSATGHLKHEQMVTLVNKRLGHIQKDGQWDYQKAENNQTRPRARFFKKNIEQMHLSLGMLGYDERHKDRYVLGLLSIILGGNMSSRLFVELREKRGLAYSISSSTKSLHDTGLFLIRGGIDVAKAVEAVGLILAELNKIKRYGVNQSEFMRAKDYLLGQLLLGLEDSLDHMLWLGEALISKNEMTTLQDVIREFKKITREDIKRVAKEIFDARHFNLALVGPITDEQQRKIGALLGLG